MKRAAKEDITALILVLLTVAVVYGHTLQVPFYLDDSNLLDSNYLPVNLETAIKRIFALRGVTKLTFVLNFSLFGNSLAALHLTNIIIHAVAGMVVFLLLRKLFPGKWLPLAGTLLFVAHPLQTQAVTYTIQRAASLSTLFVLLAFFFYLQARTHLAEEGRICRRYLLLQASSVVFAALALLSKENTVIFPLLLITYDRLFAPNEKFNARTSFLGLLPFLVAPLLLVLCWYGSIQPALGHVPAYSPLSSLRGNTPLNYLATEVSVVWVYLRLLLLPFGQALEHNYPIVQDAFSLQTGIALAALLTTLTVVWKNRRARPLAAFGVVWFLLGLSVESSIIPLDPLNEHRLYLPMFGAILIALDCLPAVLGERRALLLIWLAVALYAPLTWKRNQLWLTPLQFYQDNLSKYPDSERALAALSQIYRRDGRSEELQPILESTLQRFPDNYVAYKYLAFYYFEQGQKDEALALLDRGIAVLPENSYLYDAAAALSDERGDAAEAVNYLERGIAATGAFNKGLFNKLGNLYLRQGKAEKAVQLLQQGIAAYPGDAFLHLTLAKAFYEQQNWTAALDTLRRALKLAPDNAEAIEGYGMAALKTNDMTGVQWALERLSSIDPEGEQRLRTVIEKADRIR